MKLRNGTGLNSKIVGHLGNIPDIKKDQFGNDYLIIGVAINQAIREGERFTDETSWIDIWVKGEVLNKFIKYARKGLYVMIETKTKIKKVSITDNHNQEHIFSTSSFEAFHIEPLRGSSRQSKEAVNEPNA